jgi:hypothetical protein
MTGSVRRQPPVFGICALALGLALLTSACAGGSAGVASSDDLFDEFDSNDDNRLDQDEWGGNYRNMDTDGDGVVSHDEFNATVGGGLGGGGRR